MTSRLRALALAVWALCLTTCLLPAEERVDLDRTAGEAEADGVRVRVDDNLAGVRSFDGERLELWAQAPGLRMHVELDSPGVRRHLQLDVLNCMITGTLRVNGGPSLAPEPIVERAAACRFSLDVEHGSVIELFASQESPGAPFVFAVLSDVQSAVGRVHEIFERMKQDPELAFVVSTGDLVDTGARSELVRFQAELAALEIPFFSTVGNHEMGAPPSVWHELFGPFNVHFDYNGVAFSLVDSGNATIDPSQYERLDDWLGRARRGAHMVLTHVPPLDPSGLRGGGFRSRKEAAKLLTKLAQGRVDALFLGHIHSYYAFSAAGIPTYISGGGGAIQEKLDGIERHYLRVRVNGAGALEDVAIVRID
jgi:Icc protein